MFHFSRLLRSPFRTSFGLHSKFTKEGLVSEFHVNEERRYLISLYLCHTSNELGFRPQKYSPTSVFVIYRRAD